MATEKIIVIGASAGGAEPIVNLITRLPKDLNAAILVVWHMPAEASGILPKLINKPDGNRASNAINGEPLLMGRVYVAPPDHHLLVEKGRIRTSRGPKENHFRPAVDPLFRSAAQCYRENVLGIVLSGSLGDGTSGLWTIKELGGLAMVQDPEEAQISSMPATALRDVNIDFCVPVLEMPPLIVSFVNSYRENVSLMDKKTTERLDTEIAVARQDSDIQNTVQEFGRSTPLTCPDCHGTLSAIDEGRRTRYRCHTGHAFTAESLIAGVNNSIETALWNVIRAGEERVLMLDQMGNFFTKGGDEKTARTYSVKSADEQKWVKRIRELLLERDANPVI